MEKEDAELKIALCYKKTRTKKKVIYCFKSKFVYENEKKLLASQF